MTKPTSALLTDAVRAACEACIGNTREVSDTLSPEPAAKLDTLLQRTQPGALLPPTYHWAYFNRAIAHADQGKDMHERTGRFLPAAPFTRRMWASGEVSVLKPLRIGIGAHKRMVVTDVAFKTGSTGEMCFVTVSHQITQEGSLCIDETQTIVYRDRTAPEKALRAPGDPVPEGHFVYTDSMLFFYSAITHNGHRIHWDRDFCRDVEGYPDLVVHGPLMATGLCEALREGPGPLRFRYRAVAPVFVTSPVRIDLGPAEWPREGRMIRSDGVTSMVTQIATL